MIIRAINASVALALSATLYEGALSLPWQMIIYLV